MKIYSQNIIVQILYTRTRTGRRRLVGLCFHCIDIIDFTLFRNIFSNALAYATDATYFRVQAEGAGDLYTFTFIDNGVGVPAEHLPHIFERFYRIDKGRSRRLGGTGLGLAIVKNIALQYGGSAVAWQTPKGGLTIEVRLTRTHSS